MQLCLSSTCYILAVRFPLPHTQKRTSGATVHDGGRGDQGGQTCLCRLSHVLKHQSYKETMYWIPMTLIPAAGQYHRWNSGLDHISGLRRLAEEMVKQETQRRKHKQFKMFWTGFFLVNILDFPFSLTLILTKVVLLTGSTVPNCSYDEKGNQ